jgi:hypothetical protein
MPAAREWAPTGQSSLFPGCKKFFPFATILPYAPAKRNRFLRKLGGLPIFSEIQPKFAAAF